jgi:hypothetical protein
MRAVETWWWIFPLLRFGRGFLGPRVFLRNRSGRTLAANALRIRANAAGDNEAECRLHVLAGTAIIMP